MPGSGAEKGLHGMSKQVVLLRVGIDSGCGGIQGPLFKDGTFEFVCIPDKKRVSAHTYGNMVGRDGKPLVGYFAESRRKVMAEQHVHVDPEWETFTYGDPTPPKRSLRRRNPGRLPRVLLRLAGMGFAERLELWQSPGTLPRLLL